MTTATALAEDIAAGVNHLEKEGIKRGGGLVVESERRGWGKGDVVLVGHSDGGGLVQVACDRELVKVKALVLLSGTPSFGGFVLSTSKSKEKRTRLMKVDGRSTNIGGSPSTPGSCHECV